MTFFVPPERFNMVSYFLEGNLAAGRGRKTALVCKDRRGEVREHSFDDVVAAQNRAGNVLRELGVELEDRVLLALGDGLPFVASWFATVKVGAVVACVNPLLPAEDYAYYLEYTRAKVAVCDADSLAAFLQVLPRTRHLRALLVVDAGVSASHGRVSLLGFEQACTQADPALDPADTCADDVSVWLFTSGTTGKPKAAVHFHQDFVFNAERYAKGVLQLSPEDRTMGVPKLFFGYATGSNLMFPFAAGASTVLFHERSKPEAILENVHRFRPSVLINVPTAINGMLAVEGAATRYDLSCLRFCTSAGEALPEELYRRWKDTFGCEILDGIGSAEMFHVFISQRLGEVRPGTLGRLVEGYNARIVGPEGNDVAPGDMGTLWVHGASAAMCYWGAREKSRQTFRGDWVVTADLFRQDADGYFHYAGRADDMLKVGGIFVSPLEVEDCLLQHQDVRECAVVGVPEADLIKPKAYVVLRDGAVACPAMEDALKEHVRCRLARYKVPRYVAFLDALPRNDRGKVEKKRLRELEERTS